MAVSQQQIGRSHALELEPELAGHAQAQRTLVEAISGKRMHHAWLLHGPKGIGKARFAAQLAAYLLAHQHDPLSTDLTVSRVDPGVRLVEQGSHPDLVWLDKLTNTTGGKPGKTIPVASIRSGLQNMQSTSAYGGWRVFVVDALDDLNAEGSNALLKPLEEPSQKTVLILIAHGLQKVLPTLRSRCSKLALGPLERHELEQFADRYGAPEDLKLMIDLADGRAGRLDALATNPGVLSFFQQFSALTSDAQSRVSAQSTADRLALAAQIGRLTPDQSDLFQELVEDWMSRRLSNQEEPAGLTAPHGDLGLASKAALAELWASQARSLVVRRALNIDLSERMMALFERLDQVYSQAQHNAA